MPDDLTVIKGIGPAVQNKLRALGITTFAELAKADPDALLERAEGIAAPDQGAGARLDRGRAAARPVVNDGAGLRRRGSGADELGLALLEEGAAAFDVVPARKAGGDQLLAAREVARGRVLQHLADHRLDRADRERRVGGDRARVVGDVGRDLGRPAPRG